MNTVLHSVPRPLPHDLAAREDTDLEPLIQAALSKGYLRLPAGRFRLQRPLTLYQAIHIEGAGANLTQVLSSNREFVMRLQGEGPFQLSHLSLLHEGELPARVLWIEGATFVVERCVFKGGCWVDERDWGCGLHLTGNAQGRVALCEFAENDHGIVVDGHAAPYLESNRCFDNRGNGIRYRAQGGGQASQNECSNNLQAGIFLRDQASPTLIGNRSSQNGADGIHYADSSSGPCQSNDCDYNHQHGLAVSGHSRPLLSQNQCNENVLCGINLSGQTEALLQGNFCQANHWHGIQLEDQARPQLEKNSCSQNLASGIAYFGQAAGLARDNECHSNDNYGIQIGEAGTPFLDGNRCRRNRISGIAYFGTSAGLAQANHCQENEFHGLQTSEEAAPTVQSCFFSQNRLSGLACFGSSRPAARLNVSEANEQSGIYVGDCAEPFLDRNDCKQNLKIGITYTGTAGGILSGNQCVANLQYGIHLGPTAAPILHGNHCAHNPASDLVCLSDSAFSVNAARAREDRSKLALGFQLALEVGEGQTVTVSVGFELKPAERKVLETVARYGKSSEAQLAKVANTRRISGLVESLIEKLNRGGLDIVYREGEGPEGAIYAFRRPVL